MNTGNMTMVYSAIAVLSILLLLGYLLLEKKKERNFIFLTSCVAIVNTGYFLLAAAHSLPMALFANAVSYFGAAYSMLAMLLIISEVCQIKKHRWVRILLIIISTAAFLLAAAEGKPVQQCVALAAAEGACAVTAYDALGGLKQLSELEARIASGWETM